MEASLESLMQCTIISSEDIKALHDDLLKNKAHLTEAERAQIFAKSLHQKLDASLALFDLTLQKDLKLKLLQQTVTKANFSINALDVFKTYTQIKSVDSSNVHNLTSWLNQYRETPISDAHTLSLATQLTHLTETASSDLVFDSSSETTPLEPIADTTILPFHFQSLLNNKRYHRIAICCISFLIVLLIPLTLNKQHLKQQHAFSKLTELRIELPITLELAGAANHLQAHLQYKAINESALKLWLEERHSLLAQEPYFTTIIDTAKTFNINPLLLFAITGQEQGFVPSSNASALKIANNPFNLYGSWQSYNTSIEDSAHIVAKTVIHLGQYCPEGTDQIQWINKQYAADPNWHIGVTYFLNELEEVAALN